MGRRAVPTNANGKEFLFETDHYALRNLLEDKTTKGKLAHWALKLREFEMLVKHRRGKDQGNADFMSRLEQTESGNLIVRTMRQNKATIQDYNIGRKSHPTKTCCQDYETSKNKTNGSKK